MITGFGIGRIRNPGETRGRTAEEIDERSRIKHMTCSRSCHGEIWLVQYTNQLDTQS